MDTQNQSDPNQEPAKSPEGVPSPELATNDTAYKRGKNHKKIIIAGMIVLVAAALVVALLLYGSAQSKKTSVASTKGPASTTSSSVTKQTTVSSTIPTAINPVNPAAIPIGDGKVSQTPEAGYVDSCITDFSGQGGAQTDGPWIDQTNETWDSVSKVAVQGSVSWTDASYSVTTMGSSLMIETNDIPNHPTGVFPIASSDPAYAYDRNPNSIKPHSATWMLPLNPVAASSPGCTNGGVVGILTDGVFLYNALDGEGRDAGAHETLDAYQGHPDMSDTYHHHTVPTFLLGSASDKSSSTLVGYAADGYGIYVERDAAGNLLTNANLDACHGRTSPVMWNGKLTDIYHYDATIEYPYTIGCFHGTAIDTGVQMKM